jgi:hypothetical protein
VALHHYILFGSGHLWRQGDFKLDVRTHFQRGICPDVDSGGAKVSRHTAMLPPLFRSMNLDGQFQGESFPRPRFGHKTSSFLAVPACESQLHA